MSTTREATGEPETPRHRELSRQLVDEIGEHYSALWIVVQLEAEARSAALNEVEAAVAGLRLPFPPASTSRDPRDLALDDVSAAIAHLRQGEPSDDPS